MNRRNWLASLSAVGLLVVPSVSLAGKDDDKDHKHNDKHEECAESCSECAEACGECAAHCIGLLAAGKPVKACLEACLDCADICTASARISARKGPAAHTIMVACAAACEACAAECEKFKDDKVMAECAEECRECAAECRAHSK